jgi:hypothetical protein
MRRTIGSAIATAAAALVLPLGIMGSAATASPSNLSSELLRIGQMPTSWSVVSSSSGHLIGCLTTILEPKGIKRTASASVKFAQNGKLPELNENLTSYVNGSTAYKKIVTTLRGCKRVRAESNGTIVTISVGPLSFTHHGDASEAFAMKVTIQGIAVFEDLAVVRKGRVVMEIEEGALSIANLNQFHGFVAQALTRLP